MRRTYLVALAVALLCAACSSEADEQPAPDPIAPSTAPLRDQDQVEQDMLAMLDEIKTSISGLAPDVEWQDSDEYSGGITCDIEGGVDNLSFQSPVYKASHFPDGSEWPRWMDAVTEVAEQYGYRAPEDIPEREQQNRVVYYTDEGDALRVSSSTHSGFVFDVLTECIPGASVQS